MIYLATKVSEGIKVNIRDLAAEIDSPEPFTAKIMQSLSRQNMVSSLKGPTGGFFLTEEQANIPLLDIVAAIDGLHSVNDCGLGLQYCSDENPCPIHYEFSAIRDDFTNLLTKNTVAGLATDFQAGNTQLKRIL